MTPSDHRPLAWGNVYWLFHSKLNVKPDDYSCDPKSATMSWDSRNLTETNECFLQVNCISSSEGVTNKFHQPMEIHREKRKMIAIADHSWRNYDSGTTFMKHGHLDLYWFNEYRLEITFTLLTKPQKEHCLCPDCN